MGVDLLNKEQIRSRRLRCYNKQHISLHKYDTLRKRNRMQTKTVKINKVSGGNSEKLSISDIQNKHMSDKVVPEEPLSVVLSSYTDELSIQHDTVMTTMRTPGNDTELIKGWLNTQNFIKHEEIEEIAQKGTSNLSAIVAKPSYRLDPEKLTRLAAVSSSCGICNDTEIDNILQHSKVNALPNVSICLSDIPKMIDSLFNDGSLFSQTGGSHSCAIFSIDNNEHGNEKYVLQIKPSLLRIREDVGRHNALDKLIGSFGIDELSNKALLLSGRVSADLMQKVICAGIPVVLAIGAPSSLAIELAESAGVILIGFLKGDSFNVYSGNKQLQILQTSQTEKP